MTAQEIGKAIINGDFDTQGMNTIIEAVKQAQRLGRTKRNALAISSLMVGGTGTLTDLRPKSLNGTKVEIMGIKQTRVDVKEIGKEGYNSRYTVPAQCIIPD